jgi:hypothetical protein
MHIAVLTTEANGLRTGPDRRLSKLLLEMRDRTGGGHDATVIGPCKRNAGPPGPTWPAQLLTIDNTSGGDTAFVLNHPPPLKSCMASQASALEYPCSLADSSCADVYFRAARGD